MRAERACEVGGILCPTRGSTFSLLHVRVLVVVDPQQGLGQLEGPACTRVAIPGEGSCCANCMASAVITGRRLVMGTIIS